MSAIYRTDSPPGPAGRWFMERLKLEVAERRKGIASPTPERRPPAAAERSIAIRSWGDTGASVAILNRSPAHTNIAADDRR
jgi:hypothetical protein